MLAHIREQASMTEQASMGIPHGGNGINESAAFEGSHLLVGVEANLPIFTGEIITQHV